MIHEPTNIDDGFSTNINTHTEDQQHDHSTYSNTSDSTANQSESTLSKSNSSNIDESNSAESTDTPWIMGISSSTNQLPSSRKWTKYHTTNLLIENPDGGLQIRNMT